MTKDEIIHSPLWREQLVALAREAGWGNLVSMPHIEALERFAALVAAHEREACAKVCERLGWGNNKEVNPMAGTTCAAAIRARNVDSVDTSPERVEKTAESIRISQPHRYAGSFGD